MIADFLFTSSLHSFFFSFSFTEARLNHIEMHHTESEMRPLRAPIFTSVLFVYFAAAHTPDNSFLGFVVEQHLNASDIKHIDDIKRQNQSLVYGKVDNFWKVLKSFLHLHTIYIFTLWNMYIWHLDMIVFYRVYLVINNFENGKFCMVSFVLFHVHCTLFVDQVSSTAFVQRPEFF